MLLFALLLPMAGCSSMPEHALPVLMYHNIVPDGQECVGMTVTAGRFREDMQWLRDHGYTFVLPRELAAGEVPEKPVMVTFDDGYVSNYNVLFPILQEMDVKVALALIVCGPDRQDEHFLTWDMCREMSASGLVEFGSHSYNLHNFDERGGSYVKGTPNGLQRKPDETSNDYANRVWGDLYQSIETLEAQLNTEVCYFAYPFGVLDMWSEGFIKTHFTVTATNNSGVVDLDGGLFDMDRLTITMDAPVSKYLKS